MSRLKTGIILKNRVVLAPDENESHCDLLAALRIENNHLGETKTFVRVELIPEYGAWWLSPEEHPEKWIFVVNQDIAPGWFNPTDGEREFRNAVCDWWKEHALVEQETDTLADGFYLLINSQVKKLCRNVTVMAYDSHIGEMKERSSITQMRGNSSVNGMYGNSIIESWKKKKYYWT